jgi:hypothetical protein
MTLYTMLAPWCYIIVAHANYVPCAVVDVTNRKKVSFGFESRCGPCSDGPFKSLPFTEI